MQVQVQYFCPNMTGFQVTISSNLTHAAGQYSIVLNCLVSLTDEFRCKYIKRVAVSHGLFLLLGQTEPAAAGIAPQLTANGAAAPGDLTTAGLETTEGAASPDTAADSSAQAGDGGGEAGMDVPVADRSEHSLPLHLMLQ